VIPALAILFALGVANFALNRAVLESGHPLLKQMPQSLRQVGIPVAMTAEFVILLAAMLLAAHGWSSIVWAYGAYFALNLVSAWLILGGRG